MNMTHRDGTLVWVSTTTVTASMWPVANRSCRKGDPQHRNQRSARCAHQHVLQEE